MLHAIPPTVPAIVAPATKSSRDEFPKCRAAGGGGPVVYTCKQAQTRLYWVTVSRPEVDPEYGDMVETTVIDAEITAGLVDGMGEVKRLQILVAAAMPGWEITGLSLADEPDTEF